MCVCGGGGVRKSFHPFKGGGGGAHTVLPRLEGAGYQKFWTAIFPFCSLPPPLPVINDRSSIESILRGLAISVDN